MKETEPTAKFAQHGIRDTPWVRTLTSITVEGSTFIHTTGIDPTDKEKTEVKERAALIVRAVNNHDELTEAVKDMLHAFAQPGKMDGWSLMKKAAWNRAGDALAKARRT